MTEKKAFIDKSIVIIMAEDDTSSYTLAENVLRNAGVENEILWLKDGQETLDFFYEGNSSFDEKKKYILLLDIYMPKVDGIKVLEKIKQDEGLRQKVSVIMLTVNHDPAKTSLCYELGCNAHVIKPADEGLIQAIERVAKLL